MSYKVLNDAVGLIRDETPLWDGSYQELPDATKDGLIALWLITHPTWMDDVYPHTVSDKRLLALEAVYSEDATSRMAAAMFRDAAERNAKDVDNDAYLSEALDDFEDILDSPDFLEEIREQIYSYLEPSMEELVMDSYADLCHLDRLIMGSH